MLLAIQPPLKSSVPPLNPFHGEIRHFIIMNANSNQRNGPSEATRQANARVKEELPFGAALYNNGATSINSESSSSINDALSPDNDDTSPGNGDTSIAWRFKVSCGMEAGFQANPLKYKSVFINYRANEVKVFRPWLFGVKCPGIIAIFLGLILFIFSIKLPFPVYRAMDLVGSMTTPISMLVIGSTLAESDFAKLFANITVFHGTLIRLVFIPLDAFMEREEVANDGVIAAETKDFRQFEKEYHRFLTDIREQCAKWEDRIKTIHTETAAFVIHEPLEELGKISKPISANQCFIRKEAFAEYIANIEEQMDKINNDILKLESYQQDFIRRCIQRAELVLGHLRKLESLSRIEVYGRRINMIELKSIPENSRFYH